MKYIVLISDGCADAPVAELAGKTPLQAARMPNLNALCKKAVCSLAENVPAGVPAGSDTAILSIFGCDPRVCYTGRSPLEGRRPGRQSARRRGELPRQFGGAFRRWPVDGQSDFVAQRRQC